METLKFWITTILILAILGLLGFWAFTNIEKGGEYVSNQKLKDLQKENDSLKAQVEALSGELSMYKPTEPVKEAEQPTEDTQKQDTPSVYKYQTLISELEKLIADNINMKLKSRGTRVGTIQNFLNIYNGTSNKVDNDYGAGTVKAVTAFQKAEGLKADGEAGPTTFAKMVDWLKRQG